MGFEISIEGLTAKRAELVLALESAEAEVATLIQQQHDIDVTLDALGYDAAGKATIREKFRGQNARLVMDVLEQATGGITSTEIVRRILVLRHLNSGDHRLIRLMRLRVNATLNYKKGKGIIVSEQGAGPLMLWRLA